MCLTNQLKVAKQIKVCFYNQSKNWKVMMKKRTLKISYRKLPIKEQDPNKLSFPLFLSTK